MRKRHGIARISSLTLCLFLASCSSDSGSNGASDSGNQSDVGDDVPVGDGVTDLDDDSDASLVTCEPACGEDEFCNEDAVCEDSPLAAFLDLTSDNWVVSTQACNDLSTALATQFDESVRMTDLLPESVLVRAMDITNPDYSEPAQLYLAAVLNTVWELRWEAFLEFYDEDLTDEELTLITMAIYGADTLVPVAALGGTLGLLCEDLDSGSEKATVGSASTGFFCEQPGVPDCAANPPQEPEDCPPELLDCPDCPWTQIMADQLAEVEAAYDALKDLRDTQSLIDLFEVYAQALAETAASGQIPNPASIAVDIAGVFYGEDYPGLTLMAGVISSIISGTLAGGPIVGTALGLWTLMMGWGDASEQDEWNNKLAKARDNIRWAREYCEEINWATRQQECRAREAARFERRTAECAEADASYGLAYSNWEMQQEDCDEAQDAAQAAASAAWSRSAYMAAKGYLFNAGAMELCCDLPYISPCPPPDFPDPPGLIPYWAEDIRLRLLMNMRVRPRRIPGGGPGGGPVVLDPIVSVNQRVLQPWEAMWPGRDPAGVINWGRLERDGDFEDSPLDVEPLNDGDLVDDLELGATWELEFSSRLEIGEPIEAGEWDLRLEIEVEGSVFETVIPNAVDVIDNSFEYRAMGVTEDGVVDLTDGGDLSDADLWAHGIDHPVCITTFGDHVLLGSGAANSPGLIFDITGGGDFSEAEPWADFGSVEHDFGEGRRIKDVFYDEATGHLYVTELWNGDVFRISEGGDLSEATPYVTGLNFPTATVVYSGRVLVAESGGSQILDVTNPDAPSQYVDLAPYGAQMLLYHPGRSLFVGAVDSEGGGALFEVSDLEGFTTESPYFSGLGNIAGMDLHPRDLTWLVGEFAESGSVFELTDASEGADLSEASAFATGLPFMNKIRWIHVDSE